MKMRIVQAVVCLIIAFGMVACGGGGGSSSLVSTPAPTPMSGTLRLYNGSSVSIDFFYLSPVTQFLWGPNQISSTLGAGYYTDIVNVPANSYDAKATNIGYYSTYYAYLYNFTITAGNVFNLSASNSSFTGSMKITNYTSYTITDIYVSPSSSGSWGVKQNSSNIGYGGSLHLSDMPPDYYDLKVVWFGGAIQYARSQSVTSLSRKDLLLY